MTKTEANATHKLYMSENGSAEYQRVTARVGRMLEPGMVTYILEQHSVSVEDYLGDPDVALGDLPGFTDAAALYAWLGY